MRPTARLTLVVLFLAAPALAAAQTAPPANVGDNANIVPIYRSSDPPAPDDYLRGNLLGQRCNEPSIGVSSINPDHMIVFCNDYRATFNYDDALVPSGKTSVAAAVWNGVKTFFAWVTGRRKAPRGESEEEGERIIASAEAAVGGGVTYDGGATWDGFMVPGGPNDNTPASLAHPGKALGLQGYSDPAAISMPDGRVGVAYIGFTRDKTTGQSTQSGIFFTRYRDRNASNLVHDWAHEFSAQVALSQNLTQGQFLDKVSIGQDRGGTLYIAFTRFTGSSGSSNIFLAQSLDGGLTWTSAAIDKDSKYGQGTVVVTHPTLSTVPVGVLWRTFGTSSLVYKSTAKGVKNVDLFASDLDGPYRPFDQYSQPINADKGRVAFRTLAFPAAAYTPDGSRLVVAFVEWINLDTGKPGTTGRLMPMIVVKFSTNNGATWSGRQVLNWRNGELGSVPPSPERLGFFSTLNPDGTPRAVGAQLMPAVACSIGNQCLVVWKQSFDPTLPAGGPENTGSYVTSGFDRRFDVRGALVTFPGGALSVSKSFQVSRYGYRELEGSDRPGDVHDSDDWVAKMTLPNTTSYSMVDRGNINHTGLGRMAFAGDYIGVKEVVAPGATRPSFMVAFSDNRYNIWPWQTETGALVPPGEEWRYYPVFMAPDDPQAIVPGLSCVNYGSRVQSVMAARVSPSGLLLSAPTNRKPFAGALPVCGGPAATPCIEFPLTVTNNTGTEREVSVALSAGSFAKRPYDAALDGSTPYAYPLRTGKVTIYPYSSYSLNVYAFDDNPVTVTATAGTDTASTTLNDPAVKAASAAGTFTYTPSSINLESGSARSGSARSGSARSGSARSGSARSYPVPEDPVPGQTVYDVIDTTYVVTPGSQDDAGSYLSLFNIDPAYEGSYVFQVFVTKPLTSFMTDRLDECAAFNWTEGALLGHISDPSNPLVNGSARSGSARSGSARSGSARSAIPSDGDPLVQNTSFTLGSTTDAGTGTLAASSTTFAATSTATVAGECRIDECTLAAPRQRNEVTILVRAYQINPNPAVVYDPDGSRTGTSTPPSVAVAEYSCDDPSCTAALGPDLAVQASPAPAPPIVPNTHVRAGGQVVYPTVTVKNEGVDGQCGTDASPHACGDAQAHQWAVYASTEADFAKVPRWNCAVDDCSGGQISGTVKPNADPTKGPVTVLLASAGHAGPLPVGGTETAAVGSVTIPADIPRPSNGAGTYYLHFYDDRGRIVNELDETNNDWTEGPIIVDAPGYGFLGLQTPCTGTTCNKTGTLPLAWQFTSGSTPVDSVSTLPRLRFYGSCPAPVGSNGDPSGPVLASSSPNAADLTSGASGWQYFASTGMSRPQYTWQFNFDATGLARGTCYSMYVEVPGTGQVIGSTSPGLTPFGPFLITPR